MNSKVRTRLLNALKRSWWSSPGWFDPHTHICWAGSRANDYSLRLAGKSYSEIAQSGGGIGDNGGKNPTRHRH